MLRLGSVTKVPDPAERIPEGETVGAGHLLLAVRNPFQQSQEPNEGECRNPHPNRFGRVCRVFIPARNGRESAFCVEFFGP